MNLWCVSVADVSKIQQCLISSDLPNAQMTFEGFDAIDLTDPQIMKIAMDDKRMGLQRRKRDIKLRAIAYARTAGYMNSFEDGQLKALMNILVRDRSGKAGIVSLEQKMETVTGQAHAMMAEMLSRYKPKKLGFEKDPEALKLLVKEIFDGAKGVTKDPDSAAYAKMWMDVSEYLRKRFNSAGGNIGRLETWHLPQKHEAEKVGAVKFEEWYDYIDGKLDKDAMRNTDGSKLSPAQYKQKMREAYETISTDGISKIKIGENTGLSKLSSRHQLSRLLHFKDADSWLEYQAKFGAPDIYSSLTDHIHMMSTEIAALETLGPNPDALIKQLTQKAVKDTNDRSAETKVMKVFDNLMGKTTVINNDVANMFATTRSVMVASKLGSAMLSALSDTVFTAVTANLNGMSGFKVGMRVLKQLNPANEQDRVFATQLGLIGEYAMDRALAAHRFTEVTGHAYATRMADVAMRASGLQAWTAAGKQAFGMEFLAMMAKHSSKSLDEMPKATADAFKRYGIDNKDWDMIRRSRKKDLRGVKFIDPTQFNDNALTAKVVGMIKSETKWAVPEPDAMVKGMLNQGTKTGTFGGEFLRSVTQFKSFPVAVMYDHWARILTDAHMNPKFKAKYVSHLLLTATAVGVFVLQAKEISKGRDPREFNSSLVIDGVLQGGGLGLLGDMTLRDADRFGGSIADTLAGPLVGLVDKVLKATAGNTRTAVTEFFDENPDKAKEAAKSIGPDFIKILMDYAPLQNLWYTRAATDKLIKDQVMLSLDDNYRDKQERLYDMRLDEGQDDYWKTGELAPTRMPKIETPKIVKRVARDISI